MYDLATYASIAEIIGAFTLVSGATFGVIQLTEYRRRRRFSVAADLCRSFTQPDLARAVMLLLSLPDGQRLKDFQALDPRCREAALVVLMTYETMGLLVKKRIASFQIVQELTGGLLLTLWSKLEFYVRDTRLETGNQRFAEWVEWLVNRIRVHEVEMQPAYVRYPVTDDEPRRGRAATAR